MKMKMKLLAVCLLAAASVSLIACGDTSGENAGSSSEETAKNSESTDASGMEITFESKQVADNDDCSITITGIDADGWLSDLTLSAELENKSSDVNYIFSIESAYINGVDADPYWAESVAAGKSAVDTIAFDTETLSAYGIESATDIELTFLVYNEDDWSEDYVVDKTVHIYPYGKENAVAYERESLESDTVLMDNDSVTVILTGYEADDTWGEYCLYVYLVNNTDKDVMFSIDDASVNGYMADPFWAYSVNAGKSAFSTIAYTESTLEEIGIADMETEIETIEFSLTAYDDDSMDTFAEKTVTLNMQSGQAE